MISGKSFSSNIETRFRELYKDNTTKIPLLGDVLMNKRVSSLDIAHLQLRPLNLKTDEFASFIRDEHGLNKRDYDELVQKYDGQNAYGSKIMDLVYMHEGRIKAFAELNGPYHFRPVRSWDDFYRVLMSDYTKRCMASQLSIPLLELKVKNDVLLPQEALEVLSFFKQTE